MKISGTYKFKTQAIQDNFISLYIKVEFYSGEDKISCDDFASIVSRGIITDFFRLSIPVNGEVLNPNLITEVKVTLFASNGRGRIFYKREFPNYLQYSGISSDRLSIFSTAYGYPRGSQGGFPRGNDYHFCLAELKAYIELNEDGLFSVYGVINPNSYLDVYTDRATDLLPLYKSYRYCQAGGLVYYPILSFKDYEPLVQIGNESHAIWPENLEGSILLTGNLLGNFFYTGAGVWTSSWGGIGLVGYSPGFASSFSHKYPNTNIYPTTGFPLIYRVGDWSESASSNYYIDTDKSYSFTYENTSIIDNDSNYSYPLYTPIIKDVKTGALLFSKFYADSSSPEILKDGILLPFDYTVTSSEIFGSVFTLLPLGYYYWAVEPALFLCDDNIYTSKIVYDSKKNKWNIKAEKNVSNDYYNNQYSAIDPFLFNKTPQEYTLEYSGLDPEFTESLIEYLGVENHEIFPRTRCYSSERKTLWKYCNSVFIPEFVDWEDKA